MIRPLRFLKAIVLYPMGPDWARSRLSSFGRNQSSLFPPYGFDPARKMAERAHEKRRAHIRSVARQIREETGLPPDTRLAG